MTTIPQAELPEQNTRSSVQSMSFLDTKGAGRMLPQGDSAMCNGDLTH
jgi:hypothetical protein